MFYVWRRCQEMPIMAIVWAKKWTQFPSWTNKPTIPLNSTNPIQNKVRGGSATCKEFDIVAVVFVISLKIRPYRLTHAYPTRSKANAMQMSKIKAILNRAVRNPDAKAHDIGYIYFHVLHYFVWQCPIALEEQFHQDQWHSLSYSFLTKHREDEIFGRVNFQSSLVVIFALIVFTEFLDQSIQFFYPGPRPEIKLGITWNHSVVVIRIWRRGRTAANTTDGSGPAVEGWSRHLRKKTTGALTPSVSAML